MVRWMLKRDLDNAVNLKECIEDLGRHGFHKSEERSSLIVGMLRARNYIGMVCEDVDGTILGAMIYSLHKHFLQIHHIWGDDSARRELVEKILTKLQPKTQTEHRRNKLFVDVHEEDLTLQLFLKSCGLRCDNVDGQNYIFRYVCTEWLIKEEV